MVVVNRVKNHCKPRAHRERLTKMVVIGLGKHKGATYVHNQGLIALQVCPGGGGGALKNEDRLWRLALVENSYHELMIVRAALPEQFEVDTELLK